MEVSFLASGEILTVLDEFEGKTAKELKLALVPKVGISIFRQKILREDSCEIPNDEVLAPAQLRVQLVVLEFWPPDAEQSRR